MSVSRMDSVNLAGGDLRDTDLADSDIYRANLSNTDLSNADFSDSDLRNADLSEAILICTDFRTSSGLTEQQLKGSKQPYIFNTPFPPHLAVKKNRDLEVLPIILKKRNPFCFTSVEIAGQYLRLCCKKIKRREEPYGSNPYYAVTPKISLMNEICPKTSPLSTSLICPLRIMFIAS